MPLMLLKRFTAAVPILVALAALLAGCSSSGNEQSAFWQRVAALEGRGVDLARESLGYLDAETPAYESAMTALLMAQYAVGHSQGRLNDELPQASVVADDAEPYKFQEWKWELEGSSRADAEKLSLSALLVHEERVIALLSEVPEGLPEADRSAVRGMLTQRADLARELRVLLDPHLSADETANDAMAEYLNE